MPLLTIVLTLDEEKPIQYDRSFFDALQWSAGDALEDVQVVTLSQRAHSPPYAYVSQCPRNKDGYPIWDLLADVRAVWERIEGDYITFHHTEYCWGPGRLRRTLEALDNGQPVLALGNLRRLVPGGSGRRNMVSHQLVDWLEAGEMDRIARWWETAQTYPWAFWAGEPDPGLTYWREDVFFARREWLDSLQFFEHYRQMPFQDVYDLTGVALGVLRKHDALPSIYQLGRNVCELMHLPHDKTWGGYTEATRQWFLEHHGDWSDTTFVRQDLWKDVLEGDNPSRAVRAFRRAPGGTLTQWQSRFSGWVQHRKRNGKPIMTTAQPLVPPGLCRVQEYLVVKEAIQKRRPCNVLVFGCGVDSTFWKHANDGGRTVFIEDSPKWARRARAQGCDVIQTTYNTDRSLPAPDIPVPDELSEVMGLEWDVVFVDGPKTSRANTPGRELPIRWVSQLQGNPLILLHDYAVKRSFVRPLADRYLGKPVRVTETLAEFQREDGNG